MLFNIYLVCLIVGVLFSLLSLVLGGLFDGLDFDFDLDFLLPLKPFTILCFATVFGGAGLIALQLLPPALSLVPATGLGLLISGFLYHLVYVRLRGYETETAKEADAIMGKAQVTEKIQPGGYGRISFVMDGNTLSGAAKEISPGRGVEKGVNVYILDIRENTYYVVEDLELYLKQKH